MMLRTPQSIVHYAQAAAIWRPVFRARRERQDAQALLAARVFGLAPRPPVDAS